MIQIPTKRRRIRARRSGFTLLLVVVCLLFVTAMMGSMLRQFSLSKHQRRLIERKTQATLLAESAIERAAFSLQQNPDYGGEVWQITPEQMGSTHTGQVEIEIKQANLGSQKQIAVTATFPLGTEHHATVRKQVGVRQR